MMNKDKPGLGTKGKPRLQLKGRIYMANVTDIVCLQKPGRWLTGHAPVANGHSDLMSRPLSHSNFLEG